MPDRSSATDRSYRQESADGSYFAPLAEARYLLLTTSRQKGAPVSVRVQGIIDGDRAYFRTWSRSGTSSQSARRSLLGNRYPRRFSTAARSSRAPRDDRGSSRAARCRNWRSRFCRCLVA